jgi:hypothetical protein
VLAELMDVVRTSGARFCSRRTTRDVEQISDVIAPRRGRIVDPRQGSFLDGWRRVSLDLPPGAGVPALPSAVAVSTSAAPPW